MSRIQQLIDSIPRDVFLGVMATDIVPKSTTECLVCRLISPDAPLDTGLGPEQPWDMAADLCSTEPDEMAFLFSAAYLQAEEVEIAIADRLNRLVTA